MATFIELTLNSKTSLVNVDSIVMVQPAGESAAVLIKDMLSGKPMWWTVPHSYQDVRTKLRDARPGDFR